MDENGRVSGGYLFSAEFEKDEGPTPKPGPGPDPEPEPADVTSGAKDVLPSTGKAPALPATGDVTSISTIATLTLSGVGLVLASRRRRR